LKGCVGEGLEPIEFGPRGNGLFGFGGGGGGTYAFAVVTPPVGAVAFVTASVLDAPNTPGAGIGLVVAAFIPIMSTLLVEIYY
jgi:hypothetical protein